MDLIRPDSGKALVLGRDARHDAVAVHRLVGYLPGEFALDPRLSGRQSLTYLGNLRGGVDHAYVDALARQLDVDLDRPFGHYSRGNKQKVGLIQAFMHRPRLLILDEPTGGLDPLNQESVNELVREARAAGSTVFFSSHILSEVEALCERVGFIRDGRLARVAIVRELVGLRLHHVEAECVEPPAAEPLAALPEVGDLSVEGHSVRCTVRGDMQRLVAVLAGWGVRRLVSREPSLSEVFLNLYDGQVEE
jgi:ABC-2 type transport system ATP-binding protein